ncbi:unnamed protein product [Coccothraustes coccothraustes]
MCSPGSELAGTCVHPDQGLAQAESCTSHQRGNSAPSYTQSRPKFELTQGGSDSDDSKDQHDAAFLIVIRHVLPSIKTACSDTQEHHTENGEISEKHVAAFPNTLQKMWQIIWKA